MTRKAPAFQLYVDDFLAGTIEMSAEEVGVYIRLLCLQWSKGVVTERTARSTGGSSEAINYVLGTKFEQASDGFRNRRLEEVRRLSEIRAEAASKGGSKTAANREANEEQNGSKLPSKEGSKTQPSHSHSHSHSVSSSDSQSNSIDVDRLRDRWSTADDEFRKKVFATADRLLRVKTLTDLDLVWRASWVSVHFDIETIDVCLDMLKTPGKVNSPKGFLARSMIKLCERNGVHWDTIKKFVPPRPKTAAELAASQLQSA
jgi:uncharacterized protein YdaU (DUF1376 family)